MLKKPQLLRMQCRPLVLWFACDDGLASDSRVSTAKLADIRLAIPHFVTYVSEGILIEMLSGHPT